MTQQHNQSDSVDGNALLLLPQIYGLADACGSEPTPPPKRRRLRNASGASKQTKKTRGKKGKLSALMKMPTDIFFEVEWHRPYHLRLTSLFLEIVDCVSPPSSRPPSAGSFKQVYSLSPAGKILTSRVDQFPCSVARRCTSLSGKLE
jgi:hypothetical protein